MRRRPKGSDSTLHGPFSWRWPGLPPTRNGARRICRVPACAPASFSSFAPLPRGGHGDGVFPALSRCAPSRLAATDVASATVRCLNAAADVSVTRKRKSQGGRGIGRAWARGCGRRRKCQPVLRAQQIPQPSSIRSTPSRPPARRWQVVQGHRARERHRKEVHHPAAFVVIGQARDQRVDVRWTRRATRLRS